MTRHVTVAVLTLLILYGIIEAWPLIVGPKLTIESPADNATIDGGILTISGIVKRAAVFTLNGGVVLPDQDGHFSSTLTFPAGGSILTFIVADRFGRTVTMTRSIFVQ